MAFAAFLAVTAVLGAALAFLGVAFFAVALLFSAAEAVGAAAFLAVAEVFFAAAVRFAVVSVLVADFLVFEDVVFFVMVELPWLMSALDFGAAVDGIALATDVEGDDARDVPFGRVAFLPDVAVFPRARFGVELGRESISLRTIGPTLCKIHGVCGCGR